jgi:hypothetical protein
MYTDPGSGLFFAQVLIAGILTAGYKLRRRILAFLGRRNDSDSGVTH